MSKLRMTVILNEAKAAVSNAGFDPESSNGATLMSHLILANAIEDAGRSISKSLDHLNEVARQIGNVGNSIRSR